MKKAFTAFLVLNLLVEWMAAFTLVGGTIASQFPQGAEAATWPMLYGFAALAMGSTIFWVWPHREDYKVTSVVLGMLSLFHIGVATGLALTGTQPGSTYLHVFMAVYVVALYLKRASWCATD